MKDVLDEVRTWIQANVPQTWRDAAADGGPDAVRLVRTRAEYEAWYPIFAGAGWAVPTWEVEHGGRGLSAEQASAVEEELRPFNLGRLNILGINLTAPALFAHGTEEQRRRHLPPLVRNEERWCQLFSEPGAGSDLASLATRAERDGDEWVVTGQKVWTTWAHLADFAVLLARTDPDAPKRRGITYFLLDLHQPGVEVRPLRHLGGEIDFNEVYLDGARVPDAMRVGGVGEGWTVANATLSGERAMLSSSSAGGFAKIGGSPARHLLDLARSSGGWDDVVTRDRVLRLWSQERIGEVAGRRLGGSLGKVFRATLTQRIAECATDLLGAGALAWRGDPVEDQPYELRSLYRSRGTSIEGGTTEVNKNIVAERVLGLPREPDPWLDTPWRAVPRS
jgi:alkylation response protein AidB-like acyl-CoA dehydrogenase